MRIALGMGVLVLGLSSAHAQSSRACFNPDAVRGFEVVSPQELQVHTGRHAYRVGLRRSCPDLYRADQVAFSRSPMTWRPMEERFWRDPALRHAVIVEPVGRVCGRGEWLVPTGDLITAPAPACAIDFVQRLR